jgi:hypothetical protein
MMAASCTCIILVEVLVFGLNSLNTTHFVHDPSIFSGLKIFWVLVAWSHVHH